MRPRSRSGKSVPVALLAVCLGLAWVAYDGLTTEPAPPDIVTTADVEVPPLPDLPTEAEFAMPPARNFVEIVQRPLFSPTRHPAPQGEVTLETAGSELDLKLVGVIIVSGEEIALVAPRNGSTLVRLSEGDRFQGWTLATIEPHRVTFTRDNVAEQIELSYDQPPPVQPQPRTRGNKEKATEQKD